MFQNVSGQNDAAAKVVAEPPKPSKDPYAGEYACLLVYVQLLSAKSYTSLYAY